MDSSLLVKLTHRVWEEDTACHAWSQRGCTWKQSEPEGAVGDRLYNRSGVGACFSQEVMTSLFE